jgi:hypothetical protein
MTPDELREACFNIFIFIDAKGGTGGGIFRFMYAQFLVEAADILKDNRLLSISEKLCTAGDRWQEIAQRFVQASESPDPAAALPGIAPILRAIADQEQAIWESLQKLKSLEIFEAKGSETFISLRGKATD